MSVSNGLMYLPWARCFSNSAFLPTTQWRQAFTPYVNWNLFKNRIKIFLWKVHIRFYWIHWVQSLYSDLVSVIITRNYFRNLVTIFAKYVEFFAYLSAKNLLKKLKMRIISTSEIIWHFFPQIYCLFRMLFKNLIYIILNEFQFLKWLLC